MSIKNRQPLRAMILAAGRGERLRPLTLHTPKPLINIGGETLIERQIQRLKQAGFTELIINLHYLGDKIKAYLGSGQQLGVAITYSEEPDLLDTAGGIVKALPFFEEQSFAVVSADVISDFDFGLLRDAVKSVCYGQSRGDKPSILGHMVFVPNPKHHAIGDFYLSENLDNKSHPTLIKNGPADVATEQPQWKSGTFSGFAVFHPQAFAALTPGAPHRLAPHIKTLVKANAITGQWHRGVWFDCGTIERLREASEWAQGAGRRATLTKLLY